MSYPTELWREGAEVQIGEERAASELAKELMEAKSRATAAEKRVKELEAAGSGSGSSGSGSGSRAPSRADNGPPGKDTEEGAGVGAALGLQAEGAASAGELPAAAEAADGAEITLGAREGTHLNVRMPCLCIFDVSASALPCASSEP